MRGFDLSQTDHLLPTTNYTHVCLIPMAHSKRTDFSPARRQPFEEVGALNRWEG